MMVFFCTGVVVLILSAKCLVEKAGCYVLIEWLVSNMTYITGYQV